MSEEVLQIAVKRREAKGKGEKERYTHLNAEFQKKARRAKKAFLSDQCKKIEENNRMGKTRNLFKKIRDTKGTLIYHSHYCDKKKKKQTLMLVLNPKKVVFFYNGNILVLKTY